MAPPEKIRVGSVSYTVLQSREAVEQASHAEQLQSGGTWSAYSDHQKLIIGINPESALDVNRQDVLHEVLHCCLRQAGIWPNSYARLIDHARGQDEDIPVEEFTVSGLTGLLLGVMRDNPELMAWLVND